MEYYSSRYVYKIFTHFIVTQIWQFLAMKFDLLLMYIACHEEPNLPSWVSEYTPLRKVLIRTLVWFLYRRAWEKDDHVIENKRKGKAETRKEAHVICEFVIVVWNDGFLLLYLISFSILVTVFRLTNRSKLKFVVFSSFQYSAFWSISCWI